MSAPPTSLGNMLPLSHEVSTPPPKKKKPGRTPSAIWQLLTDEPDPQRRNSASCKHCKQQVLYYKKSEQAIRHLKKCQVFQETQHQQAFMNQFHDVLPIYQQKLNAKTPAKKRPKTEPNQSQVQVPDQDHALQMQALQGQQNQLQNQLQSQSNGALGVSGSALDQAAAQHAHAMNQLAMQQSMSDSLMDPMGLKEDPTQAKDRMSNQGGKERNKRNGALNKNQFALFEEALAMHACVTGMTFDAIEDCHLSRAMTILRPNIKLPDKKRLEGELLIRCYEKLHKQVWGYLTSTATRVCLKRDAWSNTNLYLTGNAEEKYVTYMADIKRMMQPIENKVSGVVTGSTEYHSRAWEMLKAEYPTKFFYGCISHALHLAIMDIFGPEKSLENDPRRMTPMLPMDFPFQELVDFTNKCNEVLAFFCSYQYPSTFRFFNGDNVQVWQTMKSFASASPIDWGTLAVRFRILAQAEDVLQSIVSDPAFLQSSPVNQRTVRENIKVFLLNINWKITLEKAVTILTPIELILYKFQDDRAPISEVYFESKHLLTDFDAVFGLTTVELEYIKKVVTERWQYVLSEAHGLAFLLDPRYIGKSMTRDYREQIEELIFNFPESDTDVEVNEERKRAMSAEYTDYVIYAKTQRTSRTFKWEMLEKGSRSPLQFWMTEADDWPHLKSLALTLFSLAPSSVASEKTLGNNSALTQLYRRNKMDFDSKRRAAFICINDSQLTSTRVSNDVQSTPLPDFSMGDTTLSPEGMMMWMI